MKLERKRNMRKNGAALIYVLLILLVLSITGVAVLNTSLAENKFAASDADMLQTYYLARSGAEAYVKSIENATTQITSTDTTSEVTFGGGKFQITNVDVTTPNQPVITTVGTYRGKSKTLKVRLNPNSPFSQAVVTMNNLTLANNSIITGAVTSGGDVIISGHGVITDGYQEHVIIPFPDQYVTPSLTSESFSTNAISSSVNFSNDIDVPNNTTLNIHTTPLNVVSIWATNMETNNGTISVDGGGLCILYLEKIDTYKGNLITAANTNTLIILKPNTTANLQTGSNTFDAAIYGPTSNVTIEANAGVFGAIIANNLDILSGGNLTFDSHVTNIDPLLVSTSFFRGYKKIKWED